MSAASYSASHKDYVLALYHQQGVEELFDEYAETFDDHLLKGLRYNVPTLLFELWQRHAAVATTDVANRRTKNKNNDYKCLDLGCGTGLAGAAFGPYCRYLEGVDISGNMCAQAQQKQIYNKVVHATLLSHLMQLYKQQQQQKLSSVAAASLFDLIVSADVFMYVLDLAVVLQHIERVLAVDGWLVFSTERWDEKEDVDIENAAAAAAATGKEDQASAPTYIRRDTERFAHKRQYVLDLAASVKLHLVAVQDVVLRMDDERPVLGDLYLFQKKQQQQVPALVSPS